MLFKLNSMLKLFESFPFNCEDSRYRCREKERERVCESKVVAMDTHHGCTAEDGSDEDMVRNKQWCICNNCMHRAEKAVNSPVTR